MQNTLDGYVAKLEESMAGGQSILAKRDPALAARFKQRCVDAMVLVGAYQLFVHREIFEPLMRDGTPELKRVACDLKVETIAFTEAVRAAVREFTQSEAPVDWAHVSGRVKSNNQMLRAHIAKVRELSRALDLPRAA